MYRLAQQKKRGRPRASKTSTRPSSAGGSNPRGSTSSAVRGWQGGVQGNELAGWSQGDAASGTATSSTVTSPGSNRMDLFELFVSSDLKILRATPNCLALTGFHPYEFVNISLFDFIHAEDREALEMQRRHLLASQSALGVVTSKESMSTMTTLGDRELMSPALGMQQPYPNANIRMIQSDNNTYTLFNIRFHLGGGLGGNLAQADTYDKIYIVVSMLSMKGHPMPPDDPLLASPRHFLPSHSAHNSLTSSTSSLPQNATMQIHTGTSSSSPGSTLPSFSSFAARMSAEGHPSPMTPLQQSPPTGLGFEHSSPGFPTGVPSMRPPMPPNTWPEHLDSPFHPINSDSPRQPHHNPFAFASLPTTAPHDQPNYAPQFAPRAWRPIAPVESPQHRRSAPTLVLATPISSSHVRQTGSSTGPGTVEGDQAMRNVTAQAEEHWRMMAGVSDLNVLSSPHHPTSSQSAPMRWGGDVVQSPFDGSNPPWASPEQRMEHDPHNPAQKRSW